LDVMRRLLQQNNLMVCFWASFLACFTVS
jgi:hypothetical protein